MATSITFKDVLRQLKADLIGKDSYRGVTLTYSWMANQFGHFSLGFIPTLITFIILRDHTKVKNPSLIAAIVVSVIWLLFEAYNFLGPLLLKRHSSSKLLFVPSKRYTFEPKWANVAFDTFTDLCFFWLGAFSASIFLKYQTAAITVLVIIVFILIIPCSYWFLTKMYLQEAVYPFQFRLSQWDRDLDKKYKAVVEAYLKNVSNGNHLFVFGGRRSGKTSLGVGMASELSIKHSACYYTTGMKLYNYFSEKEDNLSMEEKSLWTWRKSTLLVIDDINPGSPVRDLVTPHKFLELLDVFIPGIDNRQVLRDKNVIWIMGSEGVDTDYYFNWKEMLKKIGVCENNISAIDLGFNFLTS